MSELESRLSKRMLDERSVAIAGIATAVPDNKVAQVEAERRLRAAYPQFARRNHLFSNTGIQTRYTCEPTDWYLQARSWEERTASFQRHAMALLEEVAKGAIERASLRAEDIDAIVINTVTGLAIPSLEARLMNRMSFRPDVERLPVFGFGCGGGVAGLARATTLAGAGPGRNVLFLTVDLCSLCMRVNDPSLAMFVSSALFGDGAVGVVLRSGAGKAPSGSPVTRGRIVASGEHFWAETEHIMGWDVANDGFGVVLSPELPDLLSARLMPALSGFLDKERLALQDFDGFLLHPGGRKILETAQAALGLSNEDLALSWQVLRDYGNMSSASAPFVLHRAIETGVEGRHLLAAFGPGFSAYFMVIDL